MDSDKLKNDSYSRDNIWQAEFIDSRNNTLN